jgi:acyl transferase domain-containing protein/acyl carrier protein
VSRERDLTPLDNDIAVVGMAGRFPGARSIEEFWVNIRDGRESISDFSDDDLRREGVPDDLLANSKYVKCSPILESMDRFDAGFFGITPRDAAIMDPQHRQFLECVWEALEHAGHPPERFGGSIAVFAGAGAQSYLIRNVLTNSSLVESVGSFLVQYTGNEKDVLATRASYQFNLTGPSITVQTACSTSLVAIHLACQSLLGGESDMALAGGVTIWVPHRTGYLYREGEIRSRDGRCRPFDADADGTTFGSGVGIVVLRRLADALKDRDCVYGVIKGSAINNDGSEKVGYFAPSVKGQALAVAEALAAAGVHPESIGFVETHGTGTRIGDPIEIASLSEAYRAFTDKKGYCAIGSVKANIGHLDTAAGVAGFIKAVQALVHKQLPPSVNFRAPNPAIDFAASPFHVNTELREWKASGSPRRAAVNSLGIGGTNAHAILEEAPARTSGSKSRDWQLLVLSAKNRTALEKATDNLARHIEQHPEVDLADIAYTSKVGRSAFGGRRIAVCKDRVEAARILASRERGRVETQTCDTERRVAFLFTGQGAQYVGMGRRLYETEAYFREQIDRCAKILTSHLGRDIREVLYPRSQHSDAAAQSLRETATAQPALFTIEFALASLWRRWGVEPRALMGHSLGEYVAACLSGVFTLEDALDLLALRGRLMQGMPHGSMLAVLRSEGEVRGWLSGNVSLAAVNAPEVCVVSGPSDEIDALRARLTERNVLSRPLPVTHAFHSAMMEPILRPFTEAVRKVPLSPPRIPFASNVSGDWITDDQAVDPSYWGVEHIRKPVRFVDGLRRITGGRETVLLEIGPGTSLTALARRAAERDTVPAFVSSLPNPDGGTSDVQFLLASLGKIWLAGAKVDWNGFYGDERRNRVALPTYPFEPVRHWIDPTAETVKRPGSASAKRPELRDWFYQPSWKRSLPPRLARTNGAADRRATVAVFADVCGVGDKVAARIRQQGHPVVIVRPGAEFSESGKDELSVNPGSKEDMSRVVEKLYQADTPPGYLLHLWNVTPDRPSPSTEGSWAGEEDSGFFSLLHLAQALAQRHRSEPVHLTVVSNGMQQVAGEPLTHPTKALLLGPCKIIPREMRDFTCRSVDIAPPEPTSWQWDALIESLAAEALTRSEDDVVAYRGSERLIETFEKVVLRSDGARESPIRNHGTYLVTGGLGGLGLVVADCLVRRAGANVVLTGRTQLPPEAQWDQWLATHDPGHPTSARIRKMRDLERSGGSISVLNADVVDPRQILDAVSHAQRQFGALHGVFHLAGVLDDGLIELKTRESIERVLRPKVQGTRVLLAALDGIPLDFVVLFSSLSSVIGLAGQIDYAAANSFLNAFARHRHTLDGARVVAIDWGMWEEVGMAAERFPSAEESAPSGAVTPTRTEKPPPDSRTETQTVEVSVKTHWVLNEHRRKDGVAVMPGTGYIEFARAAFTGGSKWSPVELREIFFLAPMAIHGEERRNLRVQLERGQATTRFALSSRPLGLPATNGEWDLHATGTILPMASVESRSTDLAAIVKRCTDRVDLARGEPEHEFWSFGPRWASLKEMRFGQAEALMILEMPSEFEAELDQYGLHPALLDMATGELVTQFTDRTDRSDRSDDSNGNSGGDLFVPFSYGAIRSYRPLETLLYCHVRYRQPSLENSPVAAFDVTIANDRGEVLAEVEEFLMRRITSQGQGVDFGERPSGSQEKPQASRRSHTQRHASLPQLFQYGIRPEKGVEALERILGQPGVPQIIVSPVDLDEIRAAQRAAPGAVEAASHASGAPEAAEGDVETERFTPPPTDPTGVIRALWQEALGIEDIRENDNFFALGGHSLSLVQVAAQLRERLRIDLPLSDLIEETTVASWTRAVEGALSAAGRSLGD